jgi:hypothetical protein
VGLPSVFDTEKFARFSVTVAEIVAADFPDPFSSFQIRQFAEWHCFLGLLHSFDLMIFLPAHAA